MTVIDKILREWSFRCHDGIVDVNDPIKLSILHEMLGVKLIELKRLSYDVLTPEAKKIADELITLLGITQDQIQPSSKNNIVIYDDAREVLVNKTEESGKYGKKRDSRKGNFKVDGITITFKPDKTSGEYYDFKPQKLGLTLDQDIPLSKAKEELINGINNNTKLDDDQRKVLIYLVTNENKPTEEEINRVFSNKLFYNELLKNLGEILGALIYGNLINATEVFFPGKGNYPMIDYILTTPEGKVRVSAKTSKGVGNTIKLADLAIAVANQNGKIDADRQKIVDIINSNSVLNGAIELVKEFGSDAIKKQTEEFLAAHPDFPKLDREGHQARIEIEKNIIKELNSKFNFTDLFNQYVDVKYVKYQLTVPSLKQDVKLIESGNFKVRLHSKNSAGHDSDKIGLLLF
jgi:hypothetical protein